MDVWTGVRFGGHPLKSRCVGDVREPNPALASFRSQLQAPLPGSIVFFFGKSSSRSAIVKRDGPGGQIEQIRILVVA